MSRVHILASRLFEISQRTLRLFSVSFRLYSFIWLFFPSSTIFHSFCFQLVLHLSCAFIYSLIFTSSSQTFPREMWFAFILGMHNGDEKPWGVERGRWIRENDERTTIIRQVCLVLYSDNLLDALYSLGRIRNSSIQLSFR